MWYSITRLKRGRFIRLILTLQCPVCGALVPTQWTGSERIESPEFDTAVFCGHCDDVVEVSPPHKSMKRWLHLADMEVKRAHRDEVRRYIYKRNSPSMKHRKKDKKWTDRDRSRLYGSIMKGGGRRVI